MTIREAVAEVSKWFKEGETCTGLELCRYVNIKLFDENGSRRMQQTILRRVRESGLWIGISKNDPRNVYKSVSCYVRNKH